MRKLRLTELAKARVDPATKQDLEQLTRAFDYHDEADTIRAAFREFIATHRDALLSHSGTYSGLVAHR